MVLLLRRSRETSGAPSHNETSISLVGVNAPESAAAGSIEPSSTLVRRIVGRSRRTTRANAQPPPCTPRPRPGSAATGTAACAPRVSSTSGGGGAKRTSSCTRRTATAVPSMASVSPSINATADQRRSERGLSPAINASESSLLAEAEIRNARGGGVVVVTATGSIDQPVT